MISKLSAKYQFCAIRTADTRDGQLTTPGVYTWVVRELSMICPSFVHRLYPPHAMHLTFRCRTQSLPYRHNTLQHWQFANVLPRLFWQEPILHKTSIYRPNSTIAHVLVCASDCVLDGVVQSHRNLQCLMGSGNARGIFSSFLFNIIYMDDLSVNLKECPTGCS